MREREREERKGERRSGLLQADNSQEVKLHMQLKESPDEDGRIADSTTLFFVLLLKCLSFISDFFYLSSFVLHFFFSLSCLLLPLVSTFYLLPYYFSYICLVFFFIVCFWDFVQKRLEAFSS